jgi:hypothetical protein
MGKSLEAAIGCWTTSPDGLVHISGLVRQSVMAAKRATESGNIKKLYQEIAIMRKRIRVLDDLALATSVRLNEIITTKELDHG